MEFLLGRKRTMFELLQPNVCDVVREMENLELAGKYHEYSSPETP